MILLYVKMTVDLTYLNQWGRWGPNCKLSYELFIFIIYSVSYKLC